jgi:hypothetical protein
VREAEELERLRFPGPPLLPVRGGEPPELDQPRLAGVQLQPELRKPLAKVMQEPARILVILETQDEVVRLCRLRDYADRDVNVLVRALSSGVGAA